MIGYYKETNTLIGYKDENHIVKNENGEIEYTEHLHTPIFELKKEWVEYTEKELLENEMNELKKWYNFEYTKNEQKLRRLHTINKLTDDMKDPYNELLNLYEMAEQKRKRIQEIERLLNE